MRIVKFYNNKSNHEVINEAAKTILGDGLIVYPTDTSYGLGVNAFSENAIKRLYEIKGRDFSKPTHVVVKDWKMINKLTVTNNQAKILHDLFLPGPLTLILLKKNIVSNTLTANLHTLGVRIPNNTFTIELSKKINIPYTTPSANRSGEEAPYSIHQVKKVLDIDQVDLVIDAGELSQTLPSTMIDVSGEKTKIIRSGPISEEKIKKALFDITKSNR